MTREKPSSRGLFFILLLAGALLPSLVLPGLMFGNKVSQLVWTLVFLDLIVVGVLLQRQPLEFSAGWLDGLIGVILFLPLAANLGKPLICAVILTFSLLFLLAHFFLSSRQVAFVLAGTALVAALIGLADCWSFKIGLIPSLSEGYPGRLVGSFGQPNLFGCFLLLGLLGYLNILYVQGRTRFLNFAPIIVIGAAIFLTGSRAVSLALILSLMVVLLLVHRREELRLHLKFFTMTGVALMLSYLLATGVFQAETEVAFNPASETGLSRSITQVANMQGDQSAYQRFNYWFTAILMAKDHPLTGVGVGAYKHHVGDYMLPAAEKLHLTYDSFEQTLWPHNDFLHVLAEAGLPVFVLVLVLFIAIIIRTLRSWSNETLFLFAGFLAFSVCMMLGHPLRYPATTFAFVLVASQIFPRCQRRIILSTRSFLSCCVPVLLFIHLFLGWHVYDMSRLGRGFNAMVESKEKTVEGYSKIEQQWLLGSLEDDIHGWFFRDRLLTTLSQKAFFKDDRELAAYLLPRALEFRKMNSFHYFDFSISLLYFVLGDYDSSRDFAREAYENKPDVSVYFDVFHLNNAYIISRNEGMLLEKLISSKKIEMLKENGVVRNRHLDDRGVILRFPAQKRTKG